MNRILVCEHRTPFLHVGRILGPHSFKAVLLLESTCSLNNPLAVETSGRGRFQMLEVF